MSKVANRLRRLTAEVRSRMHRPPNGARLVFVEPCYWLLDRLDASSAMVDLGLGKDADFSMAMIRKYGLISHGFDPTRKHVPALKQLEQTSGGRFVFHPLAIDAEAGECTFHESRQNVSGSMLAGHHNVMVDEIDSYSVKVITLEQAIELAGGRVDLVKMDIEGSECAALDGASDRLLASVPQWCIEFHHETVKGATWEQTKRYLRRFEALGFRMYTADSVDFLLYRAMSARG